MAEWKRVRLGDVLTRSGSAIEVQPGTSYKQITVRIKHKGVNLRAETLGAAIGTTRQYVATPGQFIISSIDARNGAMGLVPDNLDGAIVTNDFWLFDVDTKKLDSDWLDLYTTTYSFVEMCIAASEGTTNRVRLQPAKFLALEIPLPPLPEQQRIVARVKSLLEKVEEARGLRGEARRTTGALIKTLRNSIFEDLSGRFSALRLDEIATVQLGKMLSEKSKTGVGSTPYLRNANVKWDRLDLSSIYMMDFDVREKERFNLEFGDILMCEGGDIGQSAMWRNEIPGCCYQKALHRIRCVDGRANPDFVLQQLFWAADTGQFRDVKTQTTIPHLPAIKLKAHKFYLPSLSEQEQIVDRLKCHREFLNEVTVVQTGSKNELDALPSSILARAFAGAL